MSKEEMHKLILPTIVSILITVIAMINVVHYFRTTGEDAPAYWIFIDTGIMLIFPTAPIIYGWARKDKIGSMVIGIIPMVGVALYGVLKMLNSCESYNNIYEVIRIIGNLGSFSIAGGLAGYFASKGGIKYLLIAICFGILWTFIFLKVAGRPDRLLIPYIGWW